MNDFENNGYQLVDKQDIASLAAQVNVLLICEQTLKKRDKDVIFKFYSLWKVLESDETSSWVIVQSVSCILCVNREFSQFSMSSSANSFPVQETLLRQIKST